MQNDQQNNNIPGDMRDEEDEEEGNIHLESQSHS